MLWLSLFIRKDLLPYAAFSKDKYFGLVSFAPLNTRLFYTGSRQANIILSEGINAATEQE